MQSTPGSLLLCSAVAPDTLGDDGRHPHNNTPHPILHTPPGCRTQIQSTFPTPHTAELGPAQEGGVANVHVDQSPPKRREAASSGLPPALLRAMTACCRVKPIDTCPHTTHSLTRTRATRRMRTEDRCKRCVCRLHTHRKAPSTSVRLRAGDARRACRTQGTEFCTASSGTPSELPPPAPSPMTVSPEAPPAGAPPAAVARRSETETRERGGLRRGPR
eukprot:352287-Rhodomonas_salina.1